MRALVCLHGFTGSPASFDLLAGALARRGVRRFLCPALLGHVQTGPTSVDVGGSNDPSVGAPAARQVEARFEDEVDRIATLVQRASFAGAHLLGYSLGARVALGLLARHPYLFASATLIGVNPGLGSVQERAVRAASDRRWCDLLERRGLAAFLVAWEAQPLFASQRELGAEELAAQHRIRASQSASGLSRALRVLGLGQMPDYRGVLATCPLPVRLMAGERDEKFSAIARSLARLGARRRLDLVPATGHNVLLEARAHVETALVGALAA